MKTKFLVASLLSLTVCAWAGKWTVDSFDDAPDPGDPDKFIAAESGSGLKPVRPDQVSAGGNRLYVRQKFEDTFGDEEATYQIFQGKQTEEFKSLGKISLDGIPYQTLLKMKLFYSRTASGDDDLENVYFDGKDIFVEGDDPVYMNLNGKMEELIPIVSKDLKISVTSDPPGATVTVGGSKKGETPITFTATSDKVVAVTVAKEGYYTVIKPVTPSSKVTQEGILLTEKQKLINPAELLRTQLQTAVNSKNTAAIKKVKDDIQTALKNYNNDSKKNIDAIISKIPANPPKASSESSGDFTARENLWKNAQGREREALNKDAFAYFNELKDLAADAETAGADLDFNLRYEYIPNDALEFTKWNPKDVNVDVDVSNSNVKFQVTNARLGFGSLSRNEVEAGEEDIHGVLKIWDIPNENGKYASIYDMVFFFDETPLQVVSRGSRTLPEATPKSGTTEKDLNARIAKFAGKAAWDKRDQEATLDALRRGGGGGAPAVVAQAPAQDAYYDEEEDEEEFDNGVAEQEERDYSRYQAKGRATDVFGSSDEYLFWAGVAFAAIAVGTGVMGFLENSKYQEATDAIKVVNEKIEQVDKKIRDVCYKMGDENSLNWQTCYNNAKNIAEAESSKDPDDKDLNILYHLNKTKSTNETTQKSHNTSRIIFFSAAGLSAAISITLFAW